MKDCADGDHLGIVVDAFQMSNLRCEQPRSYRVIEEIRLGELLRIFQRLGDERRIRYADACYQTWDRVHVNRLTNSSAFTATSLQPASIVSACPRPGILTISVTLLLRFCFL